MVDLGARSYWSQWRSIRCPTLVIFGERGVFTAGHGEQIADQLPKAKLRTITGAGHDVHLEAPQAWVRALTDWTA